MARQAPQASAWGKAGRRPHGHNAVLDRKNAKGEAKKYTI